MATFPARDAKFTPIITQPDTPAETEARKMLRRSAEDKSKDPLTNPGNGSVARPVVGTKVSGGAKITGGRG